MDIVPQMAVIFLRLSLVENLSKHQVATPKIATRLSITYHLAGTSLMFGRVMSYV